MKASRTFRVADLFCGAGGSSSGASRAIRAMGAEIDLVAINHWDLAIATHSENHPHARHYCVNLDAARPEDIVPDGRLDLLHHSRARGGRPVHDQRRMSAWHVQRWAAALDIRCILVENVGEFVSWGPLLPSGRPDPAGKGLYFQAWIQALWAMGYTVDWKLLNAADFGDATTRVRFFLQARKDSRPIRWPEPTHSRAGGGDMFGARPRWRAAREVIDWSNPGASLMTRKRPLSLKTRLRIARGLARFGGPLARMYIGLLDLPAEEAARFGVDGDAGAPGEPAAFVSAFRRNGHGRAVDEPLPTITASNGGGGMSLVDPTIIPYYGTGVASSVDAPVPTVTTRARFGLCSPMVVPYGPKAEARDVGLPLPTVMTRDRLGVATPTAEPFLVPHFGERAGQAPRVHDVDAPLPAVTSHGAGALVAPMIVQAKMTHQAGLGVRTVDDPVYTITTNARLGFVEPVADVATGDIDPRRVVEIDGVPHVLDIRFRMLTNRELARAMSFDDDESEYVFTGNVGEVTRQIGNAVAVRTAEALVTAVLGGEA